MADAYYHCVSRTVNGEMLFGDLEKETLRRMIGRAAAFSGVEVLTHCVMGNHFLVLARVPGEDDPDDATLLRRCAELEPARPARLKALEAKLASGGPAAEELRIRLRARMGDVSEFMKTLKQRFSIWFNANRGRFGTLWAERFKSVLVEGKAGALRTVAAYIDLNPVRAGLALDPKDYRFCGYAEAVAGNARALAGLERVAGPRAPLRDYRLLLFGKGSAPGGGGAASFDRERAARVLNEEGGDLPLAEALRCRVRYFTDGLALGSAAFLRDLATGARREPSERPFRPNPMNARPPPRRFFVTLALVRETSEVRSGGAFHLDGGARLRGKRSVR